jgi:hypothetical protein
MCGKWFIVAFEYISIHGEDLRFISKPLKFMLLSKC